MTRETAQRQSTPPNTRMRFAGIPRCAVLFLIILVSTRPLPALGQSKDANEQPAAAPAACTLFGPQTDPQRAPDDAALFAAYAAQARSIRGLHLIATVRAAAGAEYRVPSQQKELPVVIDFAQPNLLRVRGVAPFVARRVFEMASDGRVFELLIPEKGKTSFLVGPVDTPPRSSTNPRENLRPQPLIEAFHWPYTGQFSAQQPGGATDQGTRTFEMDLPAGIKGPRKAKIVFNVHEGVVNSVSTFDRTGQLISEATYWDWKEVFGTAKSESEGCFPRHIRLEEPGEDYEMQLRVSSIVLNPVIPKSSFRLLPPQGVPVEHLDRKDQTGVR